MKYLMVLLVLTSCASTKIPEAPQSKESLVQTTKPKIHRKKDHRPPPLLKDKGEVAYFDDCDFEFDPLACKLQDDYDDL